MTVSTAAFTPADYLLIISDDRGQIDLEKAELGQLPPALLVATVKGNIRISAQNNMLVLHGKCNK